MTSASSWQNSINICLASFCTQAKFACYPRCFLTSYFCIPVPYNEKDIFFGCKLQKVLQVLIEPCNFSFFSIIVQVIDLDYSDIKWFSVLTNRFKGLDLVDRVPEELWMEVCDIVHEAGIKNITKKKKCNKAKCLSEEA